MKAKLKGVILAVLSFLSFNLIRKEPMKLDAAYIFDENEILNPIWEGNKMYQESVFVLKEEDGSIKPISLLYDIDEIVEVRNARLEKKYKLNTDYKVEDGKLVIIPTGSIPMYTYQAFHPQSGQSGFESSDGGYIDFHEGSYFHDRQIVVTYYHNDSYDLYIPEGRGRLLPKTTEKLKSKVKTFNILIYGDSISTGANSSGQAMINVSPYMPTFPDQVGMTIKKKYGIENVKVYNAAVGGTDSAWGAANLRQKVLDVYSNIDFDLAIIAFGMNDIGPTPENVAKNIKNISVGIKNKYKNCETIMLATMIPNPKAIHFNKYHAQYYDAMLTYEKEGQVACNMTKMHQDLLSVKKFVDMTGNNVNHANDFLARVYAQTIIKTLEVSDYGKVEEPGDDDSSSISTSESPSESESESTSPISTPVSESQSESSSSEDSSSSTNESNKETDATKKGCNGSASTSIFGLLFTALLTFKKKGMSK